jgi:3-oxoadipate enol-lactonase
MGAVTVMRVASLFPDDVTMVIACDGQWSSPATASDLWEGRIQRAMRDGMEGLASETVARWFPPSAHELLPEAMNAVRDMVSETPVGGYVACARAMQSYDFKKDYERVHVPVHFIVGECDGKLPDTMKLMHAATPHSTLTVVKGAGHLPNIDQADDFNALLEALLSSQTPNVEVS